jgi:hypothetical protein
VCEQQCHHALVAVACGIMERRLTLTVAHVNTIAAVNVLSLEEKLDDRPIAIGAGQVEGSGARAVRPACPRTTREQCQCVSCVCVCVCVV